MSEREEGGRTDFCDMIPSITSTCVYYLSPYQQRVRHLRSHVIPYLQLFTLHACGKSSIHISILEV